MAVLLTFFPALDRKNKNKKQLQPPPPPLPASPKRWISFPSHFSSFFTGDYPENVQDGLCPNKQRSFEPFMSLDLAFCMLLAYVCVRGYSTTSLPTACLPPPRPPPTHPPRPFFVCLLFPLPCKHTFVQINIPRT